MKGYRDRKATEKPWPPTWNARPYGLTAGLTDPTEGHACRPLAEHAEDFRRHLTAKGNTPAYIDKVLSRLTAVLDHCRFVKIADVQPSAVQECLAALRRDGKSVKTANDYLDAAKGFTRWLWRDRRTATDPLAGMSRLSNGETDIRHAAARTSTRRNCVAFSTPPAPVRRASDALPERNGTSCT